jgi:predicted transcriptional regulator
MKTFKKHLNEELKNIDFKNLFEEEKELLEISIKIAKIRNKLGLSQKELAQKANITQQQLSKVENGINCNMTTFLKVCNALNMKVGLKNTRV